MIVWAAAAWGWSCGDVAPDLQRRCARFERAVDARLPDVIRERSHSDASVSVASLNLGLLYTPAGYAVPEALDRREHVVAELITYLRGGPDVLLLQEAYLPEDRELVRAAAEATGYRAFDDGADEARTGLMTLVRADGVVRHGFRQLPGDVFRLGGYVRGALWVRFEADGGEVVVANVHLSPTLNRRLSWRRSLQVAQLALDTVDASSPLSCDACLTVLGGDFNLAPTYTFAFTEGSEQWSERRKRRETRLLEWDSYLYDFLGTVMTTEVETATSDAWTIDRRNPLVRGKLYAGDPTRRIDLLFADDAEVTEARRIFDHPLDCKHADRELFLSDHFGIEAHFGR